MAGVVAKIAARKLLKGEFQKYKDKKPAGEYDPLFELRPDRKGRMVKQKKLIPDYIPEEEAAILAKVRKRAYHLDMALFSFAGVRFGWSSVIGLIPELGDVIDLVMALSLYRQCAKCGLSSGVKMQMLLWIIFDFLVGLVPLVGDIIDAGVKANTKNVRLLEQELDRKFKPGAVRAEEKRKSQANPNYRPPAPATVYEELSDDEIPQDAYAAEQAQAPLPRDAHGGERRVTGDSSRNKKSRSWFKDTRDRQQDLEAGNGGSRGRR